MAGTKKDGTTKASAVELDESKLDAAQGGAAYLKLTDIKGDVSSKLKIQFGDLGSTAQKVRGDGSV